MNNVQRTPLELLNSVIEDTVSHISDFTKNKSDFTRNRKLNATTTIKVTLNMQGQSLNTEMINSFPNMHERSTASAYEQQKGKLTPELFLHIFREYNKTNTHHNDLFKGKYQLYAIDGSDFYLPYQSKSKYAINRTTKKSNGEVIKPYSLLHANLLFNLTDRIYEDVIIQTTTTQDERGASLEMLHRMNQTNPYIVIMDRGYDGFNMIENCNRLNNGYYVIRGKSGIGTIKEITNLPNEECDVDMEFIVTTSEQYYMKNKDKENIHFVKHIYNHHKENYSRKTRYNSRWDFNKIEKIKCRVCKFRINNADTGKEEWEVLLTNLNRFEFPLNTMKDIYHLRWDIETSFRELKYALGGVQFHSRKDSFIEMELLAHLIMFNAVSRTINAVSVPQSTKKKYTYVVSFKDAVTLIRKYYRLHTTEPPNNIYIELLGYTRPIVSGRKDKRNIKPKTPIWFVYRVA